MATIMGVDPDNPNVIPPSQANMDSGWQAKTSAPAPVKESSKLTSPAGTRLMLDKKGNEYDVKFDDYEDAVKNGLDPAYEFVDPKTGSDVVVKHSDLAQAQKDGLQFKQTYMAKQAPSGIEVGAGEAAARGFANSGTMGFVDELQGALQAGKRGITDLVGGKGIDPETLKAVYKNQRDAYRLADDEAYNQNKAAYIAGGAAGVLPSALATGGTALAGSIGKAALTGGLQGAIGAAGGGTNADADLTKGQYGDFAKQVGEGAALGGGLGAAGEGIAKLAPGVAQKLSDFANSRASKVLTSGYAKGERLAERLPGGTGDFGSDLQRLGIVSPGKSVSQVKDAAEAVKDASGQKIGDILSQFDSTNAQNGAVNVGKDTLNTILDRINKEVITPLEQSPATEGLADRLKGTYTDKLKAFAAKKAQSPTAAVTPTSSLDDIMAKVKGSASLNGGGGDEAQSLIEAMNKYKDNGMYKDEAKNLAGWLGTDADKLAGALEQGAQNVPGKLPPGTTPPDTFGFRDLQRERSLLDKLAYTPTGVDKPLNDELQKVRRIFNDELFNSAGQVMKDADPGLVDALKQANRDYSVATTANNLGQEQVSRMAKNRSLSLTDYLSGIGAAATASHLAHGNPMALPIALGAAATAPLINKLGRERGNQLLSGGAKELADLIKNNPKAAEALNNLLNRSSGTAGMMVGN